MSDRVRTEPGTNRVRVSFAGETVADSERPLVLHETGLPDVYYFPPDDVRADLLVASDRRTWCPYKGEASYWSIWVGDKVAEDAVWGYREPIPGREDIAGYLAFYRDRVDIAEG